MALSKIQNGLVGVQTDGIRFGTDAAVNNLDDYEEGTWNFSVFGDTSISATSPAVTEYTNVGTAYYTKIGNQVSIGIGSWNMASLGLSSGGFLAMRISLPFATGPGSYQISPVTGYNLIGRYSSGNLDGFGFVTTPTNASYLSFGWNTTNGGGAGFVYLSGTGVSVSNISLTYFTANPA